MTLNELLAALKEKNAALSTDGTTLYVKAPRNMLSPLVRETLAERKEEIIAFLRKSARPEQAGETLELQPYPRTDEIPVSYYQQGMWIVDRLDPGNPAYNIPMAFKLKGNLNQNALQQALTEIVRRHEILRTHFEESNGQVVQVITDAYTPDIAIIDFQDYPDDEKEYEARKILPRLTKQAFDLTRNPLYTFHLLKLGAHEHIFLLTIHHIIFDGWSHQVVLNELTALYNAYCSGQEPLLPELPFQYTDYTQWQVKRLEGERFNKQSSFWKEKLADAPQVLHLPTDHPRPPIMTTKGGSYPFSLSFDLTNAIRKLAREQGSTPFMILLSALYVLLYRYTGQSDITIGSPIANRPHSEVELLIGDFINTLALRQQCDGAMTFVELLQQVRNNSLEAFAHQDIPFEKVIEALHPLRDPSYTPLFQVLFSFQNLSLPETRLHELTLSPLIVDVETAQFDLSFYVWENKQLGGRIEYNADLFEKATILRLLKNYTFLLEQIVEDPRQAIAQLPVISLQEHDRLFNEWNNTKTEYPHAASVHELFEDRAAKHPDETAVICGDETISYRELNHRANQLARKLQSMQAGPGSLIGLCMQRSIAMVTGLLGILKTGAAYVPLDPNFPRERLSYMIEESAMSLIVSEASLIKELIPSQIPAIALDREWKHSAEHATDNPQSMASPDDLAYLLYTSGSTGKPKGVAIPHRAMSNFLLSMSNEPGITPHDRLLAVTTLSFDISVLEIFLPLISGAKVHLLPQETAYDAHRLISYIEQSEITMMQATPATWQMLLDAGWQGSKNLTVLCGGEALTRELAEQLLDRSAVLWNMYGPTETTVWSCIHRVTDSRKNPPIGRPIANTEIYLLDKERQPVPIGVVGELHIGGAGLARGYLHKPELTAEKFIPHPFSDHKEARLYATGDLARYLPDGTLECLGRIDNQVKIRGYRIELGEIESVLQDFPAVQQAAVALYEATPGDKQIAAYYVPASSSGKSFSLDRLRSFMRESLPDYMLPAYFTELEALPLTPNGKVDRKALPAPETGNASSGNSYTAPRNIKEQLVAAIWSEILGRKKIGIHENFFMLGGHSLLATKLIYRLNNEFSARLTLRSLFLEPTIAGIATLLRDPDSTAQTLIPAGRSENNFSILFPVQPKGSRLPLFFVAGAHPVRESVDSSKLEGSYEHDFFRYMSSLIPHLGLDQPLYGFRPQGWDGKNEPHNSVRDMAAAYIRELKILQPEGPYLIGGECVGGIIAYEMAQQLKANNEEVALLVLMDTYRPNIKVALYFRFINNARKLRRTLRKLLGILKMSLPAASKRLKRSLHTRVSRLLPIKSVEQLIQKRIRRMDRNYQYTLYKYRTKAYDGKVTLIVNKEAHSRNPSVGWEHEKIKELEVYIVPGDHITRLTEYGEITGTHLRNCINSALNLE